MVDLWGEIGTTAGKVHTELTKWKSKGACDLADVRKSVSADEKVLLMAVGWLAREDNVVVGKEKTGLTVKLKG